jgi:serine/threonine protein kinase
MNHSAAENLVGQQLDGGWTVKEKIVTEPDATGGNFSIGYVVSTEDGVPGFLKALDFSKAFSNLDPVTSLRIMTSAFEYERDILEKCRTARMSRIVRVLDSGTVVIDGFAIPQVPYLIFEWADGDVRSFLSTAEWLDNAVVLRCLHDVSLGLRQLHVNSLAHRDLKPSNVLVLPDAVAKLADLGRAAYGDHPDPFDPDDLADVAGDLTYAPLEALYGERLPGRDDRRLSCDAYLLGSLAMFFFSNVSATPAVMTRLHEDLRPAEWNGTWAGTYEEVLPYVRGAFDDAMEAFEGILPSGLEEVAVAVRQLCDPDPTLRGHPRNRVGIGNQFSVERYVSIFDRLARAAELRVEKAVAK